MATYTNILFHVVFSTKDRLPLITHLICERLHDYLGGAIRGHKGVPYQVGGTVDHVHLLFRSIPSEALSDVRRDIKSGATQWVHEHYPMSQHFAWQSGYGAFSVSHSQRNEVISVTRRSIIARERSKRSTWRT